MINLPLPHNEQLRFIQSPAKRKVVRAGRRGGKTVGMSILAVDRFLKGQRVLYATPTSEQIARFWFEVKRALQEPIKQGIFKANENMHIISLPGTEQQIRAKTAWNADSLRGDYGDLIIFDEYQLMDETSWEEVGAPMLLDNNGDAVFIYTPPSLRSRSRSKAIDPQHAAKLFKRAQLDKSGRWAVFHFPSSANPYISKQALRDIIKDMSNLAIRQEINAEDIDEAPGALWSRADIDAARVVKAPDDLQRIVVAIDPSESSEGNEAGIITVGKKGDDYYQLADDSLQAPPEKWAEVAITAFYRWRADCIVAEKNAGGEMVMSVIKQQIINAQKKDKSIGIVPVKLVWASRGKQTRAEPIATIAAHGRLHHVGVFPQLEDELCLWVPGDASPNRLDAHVWGITELSSGGSVESTENPFYQ